MKTTVTIAFTLLTGIALHARVTAVEINEDPATRSFEFIYTTTISGLAAGRGPVHIFLPLPLESERQSLDAWTITSSTAEGRDPLVGSVETESEYGNRYWHAILPEAYDGPIEIEARYEVTRRSSRVDPASADHDRAVDNITYKKIGTGWGNGDTFWACSERYGNCTDFHSLFISLARTKDIPARFDMGFPVPEDRPQGNIGGYHCWVNFYLPDTGWFPIDASEAVNYPERRELYFGGQPLDRIHFTTGRDLRLGSGHQDQPLNYFIYPYVEVGGERFEGRIESSFSYRNLASPTA